ALGTGRSGGGGRGDPQAPPAPGRSGCPGSRGRALVAAPCRPGLRGPEGNGTGDLAFGGQVKHSRQAMPSARPVWKGQLRLSLVAIPVELYSAAKTGARLSFRQIHEPSGKPIKYEKVVPGIGPVDTDEILKGFEYEKNDFVLLQEEEIDAVKLETRKTLELVQFVGGCEIDPIYFDKSYYIVPQ